MNREAGQGDGDAATAEPTLLDEAERELERLIEPGLQANAWRRDYDALRRRRLWNEKYHARRIRILKRAIPKLRRKRILDIGCGRGGFSVALRREGCRVVPLDLRRSSCRVTRLRAGRYGLDLQVVRGRGEQLPFRARTFDVVICRDVMEHAVRPGRMLREVKRVLKKGGVCFVTVINRFCWVDPHYHMIGLSFLPRRLAQRYVRLRGRSKASGADRQQVTDMHYYSYGVFRRWAVGMGFAVQDLILEQLLRNRKRGLRNAVRWLRYVLLQPFSLQGPHFEFLLVRPRVRVSREVRS